MNKKRLEKLIVALDGVRPGNFNMEKFSHPCGSPSCVLGHYASRGDLQRTFDLVDHCGGLLRAGGELTTCDGQRIREHFSISRAQAEALFGERGCNNAKTPKQAQKFIHKFIDSNGEL